MSEIKIHIFHIGKVCVAPELPFGGEHYSALKASGVLDRKSKRLWLPVSAYLIECAHGNVLFDCGWHRDMSPHGVFERGAQIRSARLAAAVFYESGCCRKRCGHRRAARGAERRACRLGRGAALAS